MQNRRSIFSFALAATLAAAAVVPSAQEVVETVHLVIAGGPNAGTFDAQGSRAGCSAGAEGPIPGAIS